MMLTPMELERRRKEKGHKLNHPEIRACIADTLLDGARE